MDEKLKKEHELILYPTKNNKSEFIKVDQKGSFEIKNFFPLAKEKIKISLINKSGKPKRPKMAMNSLLLWEIDSIDITPFQEYNSYYSDKNDIPLNFMNKNEVLNEIVISSRLDRVFNKKGPKFQGSIIKINDSIVNRFNTVERLLGEEKFIFEYNRYGEIIIKARERTSKGNHRAILFYIDGVPFQNTQILLTSGAFAYEDVYIDYSYNNLLAYKEFKYRFLEKAIIVNFFGRITPFEDPNLNMQPFNEVILTHGFESKKEFYTPRYINYQITAFRDFGVIHWEPKIDIKNNRVSTINTIDTNFNRVNFYIEGIASDGNIFSQVISLDKTYKP